MKNNSLLFRFLAVPIDFIVIFGIFLLSFFLRKSVYFLPLESVPELDRFIFIALVFTLIYQLFLFLVKGYHLYKEATLSKDIIRVIYASCIWVAFIASYFFWTRDFFFSRFVLLFSFGGITIALIFVRLIFDILKKHLLRKEKVFILGDKQETHPLCRAFERMKIYTVENGEMWHKKDTNILVVLNKKINEEVEEYIEYCLIHHIRVFIHTPNLLRNKEALDIQGLQMYEIFDTPLYGWQRVLKRFFDIMFSLFALLILLPLNIIISFLILLPSKGPVIVGLMRICRGNKMFKLYKFRSMIVGAEKMKKDLMKENEREDGPLFKMKNDPRITTFGRFIRKTRIDEIPQFWNVLMGDMSVVGPRPHEPSEVEKYTGNQKKLLQIKPGMTGMAQVCGASDLTFTEEVRLDMDYVQHWSIWKDLWIISKTIWVVIRKKGAV